jgi:large subunit ribosomal protein L3
MDAMFAKKIGMTNIFGEQGEPLGVTALKVSPSTIVQIKTIAHEGYNALQLGYGSKRRLTKPELGHMKTLGKFTHLGEVRYEQVADCTVGQKIDASIFSVGSKVDIVGVSKGKSFAGGIKRHHFSRGPMSHGHDHHRQIGSIGQRSTPGKVLKGKRMPGRMGHETVCALGLRVVQHDPTRHILYVQGSVPGPMGNLVMVRRSVKSKVAASE